MKSNVAILTVIGKDRPGIIAEVTGVLFRYGCNLEDVSMTILEGEFVMLLVVHLRKGRLRDAVERHFKRIGEKMGLTFFWKELRRKLVRGESHPLGSKTYLMTAMGRDRTGIVYGLSQCLAGYRLNITDLNSRILGSGKKAVYTMILEVDVPKGFSVKRLEASVRQMRRKLGIEIQIKPVERIEL